jgi:hypothetical protein
MMKELDLTALAEDELELLSQRLSEAFGAALVARDDQALDDISWAQMHVAGEIELRRQAEADRLDDQPFTVTLSQILRTEPAVAA